LWGLKIVILSAKNDKNACFKARYDLATMVSRDIELTVARISLQLILALLNDAN
jgi:hypothetical protein